MKTIFAVLLLSVPGAWAQVGVIVEDAPTFAEPEPAPRTMATPAGMINTLLTAPYNEPPATLTPENGWQPLLTMDQEFGEDYPGYSKFFRRKTGGMTLDLMAYAAPSLTDASELVLSGQLEICAAIDSHTVHTALEANGFTVKLPRSRRARAAPPDNFEISKGSLSGSVKFPSAYQKCFSMYVSRADVLESYYDRKNHPEKPWAFSAVYTRLMADLEKQKIAMVIGPDWPAIKQRLGQPMYVSTASVSGGQIANAIIALGAAMPHGPEAAPRLVLRQWLTDLLFAAVNYPFRDSGPSPESLALLDKIGVEYNVYMEAASPTETQTLYPIFEKHPADFWGQYAFFTEMATEFTVADNCKNRAPIAQAELNFFMKKYPNSPFATGILFLLAKANDTLYTLSVSGSGIDVCRQNNCAALAKNTDFYRTEALRYYGLVLARSDAKPYEPFIKYVLPRLKAKGISRCLFYAYCNPD